MHDLHVSKKLFHGDIKPANIFISLSNQMMITDSGTLIPLYCLVNDKHFYRIKAVTPKFCSQKHFNAWKEDSLRTYQDLMKEDYYQMKKSIKAMVTTLSDSPTALTSLLLDKMSNDQIETVEQLRAEILQNSDLCMDII